MGRSRSRERERGKRGGSAERAKERVAARKAAREAAEREAAGAGAVVAPVATVSKWDQVPGLGPAMGMQGMMMGTGVAGMVGGVPSMMMGGGGGPPPGPVQQHVGGVNPQALRQAKRLYIGNVPPQSLDEETLKAFLNTGMLPLFFFFLFLPLLFT